MEFPIKVKVTPGYHIEKYHKGEIIAITTRRSIPELEEFLAEGKYDMDLYEGLRQMGGEYVYILQGLERMKLASFPGLAEVFKKVEEERWGDITEEEDSKIASTWEDVKDKEWILTWTPADVEWEPEVDMDKAIFHRKYKFDELMLWPADEVRKIARVKGTSTKGRKEDIARAVHLHDFGEEEMEKGLEKLEGMLKEIG